MNTVKTIVFIFGIIFIALIIVGYVTGEGIGFGGGESTSQATVNDAIAACKKWGGKVIYDGSGDYSDCLINGRSADSY